MGLGGLNNNFRNLANQKYLNDLKNKTQDEKKTEGDSTDKKDSSTIRKNKENEYTQLSQQIKEKENKIDVLEQKLAQMKQMTQPKQSDYMKNGRFDSQAFGAAMQNYYNLATEKQSLKVQINSLKIELQELNSKQKDLEASLTGNEKKVDDTSKIVDLLEAKTTEPAAEPKKSEILASEIEELKKLELQLENELHSIKSELEAPNTYIIGGDKKTNSDESLVKTQENVQTEKPQDNTSMQEEYNTLKSIIEDAQSNGIKTFGADPTDTHILGADSNKESENTTKDSPSAFFEAEMKTGISDKFNRNNHTVGDKHRRNGIIFG